jgi:hypothetical protein
MSIGERRPTLQTVGWVRDMYTSRQLDLDPPYQRRSAWNMDFKQFFIDTILRNYPIPPIFVNIETVTGGKQIYHVIDGKQRLLSINEFLSDVFPISDEQYSTPTMAGKYFSQLEENTQKGFYGYFLPFEFFTDLATAEVVEIFDRFNRNVARLNAQELRHAKWDGRFITLMEQLADESFWEQLQMFGKPARRRMKDVEYVSILFSLIMHGITEGDDLDTYYADYDSEIPNVNEHLEKYNALKKMTNRLRDMIKETRFGNLADFYSLWSTLFDFISTPEAIDYKATIKNLVSFASKVDDVPKIEDVTQADEDALAYSRAIRAGTTKQPNRETRKQKILKNIVCK